MIYYELDGTHYKLSGTVTLPKGAKEVTKKDYDKQLEIAYAKMEGAIDRDTRNREEFLIEVEEDNKKREKAKNKSRTAIAKKLGITKKELESIL